MVKQDVSKVSSLGRNGLFDWIIQRITAYILLAYSVFMISLLLSGDSITFSMLETLMQNTWMKIITFLAVLSVVLHAWVGLWTVFTDYLTASKVGGLALGLRGLAMFVVLVTSIIYLVWAVQIIWGVNNVA